VGASRTFEVKFIGNIKGLKGSINDLQKTSGDLGKSFTGMSGIMKGALAGVSFYGIVRGLQGLTSSSIEASGAQHRLRQILMTTGGAVEGQVDQLLAQATAISKVGIASKENIVVTQAQLATFDLQAATIQKLTPAILDYVTAEKGATATADDFKSMTNGLALALGGQFGGLTRVGFTLDEHTKKMISSGTESQRAEAIVKVLNSTYEGFNESLSKTPEGRIILLKREFAGLKDELGRAVLPAILSFVDIIRTQVLPILQAFVQGLTGNTGVAGALTESAKKAWAWGYTILAIIKTIIAMKDQLIIFGGVLVAMWSIAKVTAAAGAIYKVVSSLITVYQALTATAAVATTAQAAATGGISLVAAGIAAAAAAALITTAIVGATYAVNKYNKTLDEMPNLGDIMPDQSIVDATGEIAYNFDTVAGAADNAGKATKQLDQQLSTFKTALSNANKVLEEARNRFNDYAKSVADVFKSVLNFGGAFDKSSESIKDAEEATRILAYAQARYQETLSTGKIDEQKDALVDLQVAQQNAAKSLTSKKSFLEVLQEQADKSKEFANKVQQLIKLGLSESAIQQVLQAGADAGTAIADEIIAGGASIVDKVNTLIEATASVADQVGKYGAEQFYRAGITQGEALVRGILDAIQAAGLKVDATGNITAPASSAAPSTTKTPTTTSKPVVKKPTAQIGPGGKIIVPKFATGGIVNQPTLAIIGEAGPEAVVPLSKMPKSGATYNINVNAGMGANGSQIGKEIVDAIKRYERASGPVFASA
jgi:hypothetical protein